MRLKVLFAGGGTGGHLFPGLEVARALVEACGAECVFWGTGRQAEVRALAGTPFRLEALPATPWGGLARLPRFLWGSFRALRTAVKRVRALGPRVVIGLGGYASAAPAAAAALAGTPVFLLEQNAVPGRANRLLSRFARAVFVPWQQAAAHFPSRARVAPLGNPVRKAVLEEVAGARAALGLSAEKRTLLVMGGSQGAQGLNRALLERADLLGRRRADLQVIHLAGAEDAPGLARRYREVGVQSHVAPYLEEMQVAYSAADLALARAGGTSIAELACRGLPAVLVPFPAAAEDHQTANARAIAASGGAIVVREDELAAEGPDGASGVERALVLLFDEPRRRDMAAAMRRAGRPEAAREIVKAVLAEA